MAWRFTEIYLRYLLFPNEYPVASRPFSKQKGRQFSDLFTIMTTQLLQSASFQSLCVYAEVTSVKSMKISCSSRLFVGPPFLRQEYLFQRTVTSQLLKALINLQPHPKLSISICHVASLLLYCVQSS